MEQLVREKELLDETKRIRREKQQINLKQLYAKLRLFEQRKEENLNEKEMNKQLAIENKARLIVNNFQKAEVIRNGEKILQ